MAHQGREDVENESFSLRSLVVDDDFVTLKTVCRMLNAIGCWTDSANCGEAAMRCLKKSRYDFVLTDWMMSDIDGCKIAKWVRRRSRHTKVIIMTGSSPSDIIRYRNDGIVDLWLFKPFTLQNLAGVLRDFYPQEFSPARCTF